jgi:hypothetical protein
VAAADVHGIPVYQPAVDQSDHVIGFVDSAFVAAALDAAAFRILPEIPCSADIDGIGSMGLPAPPVSKQQVFKLGYMTGTTEGEVAAVVPAPKVSVGAPGGVVRAQIGDSGAVWFDKHTLAPLALHTGLRYVPKVHSHSLDMLEVLAACGL